MKKILIILLILFTLSSILITNNNLNENNYTIRYELRAGGGGGGSSGGGGNGGTSSSHGHTNNSNRNGTSHPISIFINHVLFIFSMFIGSIVFYNKILKSSINSKRYLKILGKKEPSWKYRNIEEQAIETFYILQESWTNMDLNPAKPYMSEKLYDNFTTKLNFMEMCNKRNVLKKIQLKDIKPVSINDDEEDDKDYIWFYIKGKMIDYIINTKTDEIIDGNTYRMSFIEFWKFTRQGKDKWVLTKIKQKDEAHTINFE